MMPTETGLGPGSGPRAPEDGKADEARPAHPLILAVDDEPDMLLALELYLSGEGFEVTTAPNVHDALRRIEDHRPALILTDYIMPGVSGLELCRTLRGRRETRSIPIIMHTGWDLWQDHPGLFDHLVFKPAELDSLARLIRTLLAAR